MGTPALPPSPATAQRGLSGTQRTLLGYGSSARPSRPTCTSTSSRERNGRDTVLDARLLGLDTALARSMDAALERDGRDLR